MTGEPYIIGVTGGSGSGKSLFIKEVIRSFTEEEVCFISQDNYYRPRDKQPADERGVKNFDMPESIDIQRFAEDIERLKQGKKIVFKEYTFNNPALEPQIIEMNPAPIIILEGIFIFHVKEIADLMQLKIFIEASEHIMIKRRVLRDKEERGYDLDDVLYRYEHHVMPAYNSFILPYRKDADIIINNQTELNESVKVLRSHIAYLLKS